MSLSIFQRTPAQKIVPPRDWKEGEDGRAEGAKEAKETEKALGMGEGRGVGRRERGRRGRPGAVAYQRETWVCVEKILLA